MSASERVIDEAVGAVVVSIGSGVCLSLHTEEQFATSRGNIDPSGVTG